VEFGVLTAVAVKITDFWDAVPLTEVTNHQTFERTATSDYREHEDCRFFRTRWHDVTTHKIL